MKVRTRKVYNCEHCNKLYLNFKSAEKHELSCGLNPVNKRPCFNCKHCMVNNDVIAFSDLKLQQDALFCKMKMEFLLPPKAVNKNLKYNFENYENNPMPRTCNDFTEGYSQDRFFTTFD